MAQQLRISTALYLIVGIGAYFAWSPAVVITSGLWPDASAFLLDLNWTCNLLGHTVTLALLSLFMRNIAPLAGKPAGLLAPSILVALGTLLLAIAFLDAHFDVLVAPASLLSGAGMACLLLIWSESLISVPDIGVQHLVVEASVISGLLMTVVIICLPPLFGALVCAVLPFATSLCSRQAALQLAATNVGSGLEEWGACVMQIGYQLFLIYIYTEFAHMADERPSAPCRIFTMGTCAIDLGLFAGYLVITGTTLFRSNWVQVAILVIVYLLILVGILVFPRVIDQDSARAKKGIPSFFFDEPGKKRSAEPSGSEAVARFASTYGLSSREEEIMQHLIRGRTLPSIAEETCLSYNTVKTHVSHIYQKAGVHTRDELLDILDENGAKR